MYRVDHGLFLHWRQHRVHSVPGGSAAAALAAEGVPGGAGAGASSSPGAQVLVWGVAVTGLALVGTSGFDELRLAVNKLTGAQGFKVELRI